MSHAEGLVLSLYNKSITAVCEIIHKCNTSMTHYESSPWFSLIN